MVRRRRHIGPKYSSDGEKERSRNQEYPQLSNGMVTRKGQIIKMTSISSGFHPHLVLLMRSCVLYKALPMAWQAMATEPRRLVRLHLSPEKARLIANVRRKEELRGRVRCTEAISCTGDAYCVQDAISSKLLICCAQLSYSCCHHRYRQYIV